MGALALVPTGSGVAVGVHCRGGRPHVLPDGFIERAVQIVVRDREVRVNFSVGLNPETMREVLAAWQVDDSEELRFSSEDELRKAFGQALKRRLLERAKLTVNGEPLEFDQATIDLAVRHPYDLTVQIVGQLPADRSRVDLGWKSDSLTAWTGTARLACKAMGKAILIRSNVAPIVVRAKQVELSELKPEARSKACHIRARLMVLNGDQR